MTNILQLVVRHFVQLLSENVHQHNGITKETIKLDGVYDDKGNLQIKN